MMIVAYGLADVVSNHDSAINAREALSLELGFQVRDHLSLCRLLEREDLELQVRLLGPLCADQRRCCVDLLC